jgi:hypothetical protein
MPTTWQLAALLAVHLIAYGAVAWIVDRRQANRSSADHAMNQQLLIALQDLFEQRARRP